MKETILSSSNLLIALFFIGLIIIFFNREKFRGAKLFFLITGLSFLLWVLISLNSF